MSAVLSAPPVAAPPTPRPARDSYLDALRAGSLLVVVLWHLLATRLTWAADGPHTTSPLGTVPGLWLGTWVLQVMPVFFYVGGHLHSRSYRPGPRETPEDPISPRQGQANAQHAEPSCPAPTARAAHARGAIRHDADAIQ